MKRKNLINLLTMFISLISVNAYAHDIAVQNGDKMIYYNFINDNTELEVTYKGTSTIGAGSYTGDVVIPESVIYDNNTYRVTSIGSNAFSYTGLTSITIPNSVTSIGNEAFCQCSSLTSIIIPNSVTSIGDKAFMNCKYLTSFTIPSSVISIGDYVFNYCESLVSLNVESDNTIYDSRDNCNAIITKDNKLIYGTKKTVIPNSVTSIGASAFLNCRGFTSITIPSSVTSIGEKAFCSCYDLTSIIIPESVTSIGNLAFENCIGLTSITLPNNVTSIGDEMFYGCESLSSITIPNNVTSIGSQAFSYCTGLTSITIPNSVTSIGTYAFNGCSNLTSVTVEAGTPLSITKDVFSNRTNATLYVPAGTKATYENENYWKDFKIKEFVTPSEMFVFTANSDGTTCSVTGYTDYCVGEVTIPESWEGLRVTSIGVGAFRRCYGLTSITIPNSVTSICNEAFSACTDLTSITIPKSVTSIGSEVFKNCYALASMNVESDNTIYDSRDNCNAIIGINTNELICGTKNTVIPSSVTSIGAGAFYFCTGLTSIEIPNSVTSIGDFAFGGCDDLTSIEIPNSVTSIGDGAFSNTGLTSITIPKSVTSIGSVVFVYCKDLASLNVDPDNTNYDSRDNCNAIIDSKTNKLISGTNNTVIPNGVTSIGVKAFKECTGLTSITIPNSVTSIGSWAFENCKGLTSITIPSSVTTIDNYAFTLCTNLASVTVESATPIKISEGTFVNKDNATLYVPVGSKTDYAAATGWKDFSTIVEGYDGSTFIAKTAEGIDMVFTVLDNTAKTCQVGYLDGSPDKTAVDKDAVDGSVTIPETAKGYRVVKIGRFSFDVIRKMTSVTIPNTVTVIDDYAFNRCSGLTSLELPASVTSIGVYSFYELSNATSIKVAEGNQYFDSRDNCNAIIESATNKLLFGCNATTIPTSVERIGEGAFANLYEVNLSIPSSVIEIEDYAFNGEELTFQVDRTTPLKIGAEVFAGVNMNNSTLRVPAGSKSAYAEATGWNYFSTILEGDEGYFTAKTAEEIDMVFTVLNKSAKTCQVGYYYSDVTEGEPAVDNDNIEGSLTIPETANGYTVVKIGKYALKNLNRMRSVTIPNTVTSIEEYAFENCNELTSLEIPASVTSIGAYAFYGLSNATSVKVAAGNPRYDSRDNCNAIIETATNKLLFGCTVTTIPTSVSKIGEASFGDMNVYNLSIPSSVTEIDDYAFSGYELILQVDRTDPLVINENAFINLGNSTLRVPAGSKAAYEAATGWCQFSTIFEGEEGSTFKAETKEGVNMVFTILDDTEKTCQVGYWDGSWDKPAVDRETVSGSVTIPETVNGYTVVKIGKSSFSGVSGMTSVTIPNTVTSIDDDAFISCSELTSLELSANVTTIGSGAFFGLSGATSILVAEKNAIYDSRDNSNAIIETATDKLLFGCKNTAIPATVKEIERRAFSRMFNCTILIPSTINKINDFAFEGSNVTIQVERTEPLEIHENAINLRNSTLRVPAGSKAAYEEATGWSKFDKIVEMEAPSVRTINVETAGTLSSKISDEEKFTITDLTITGQLNGIDLCFIREMAGSDYNGVPTDGMLQSLDLSGATIVAGGAYLELADQCIYLDKEKTNPLYGFIAGTYSSVANTFGDYLFAGCQQLNSVKTPGGLTRIGEQVFAESGLTSIELNYGLTTIDDCAFWYTKLKSITIPNTVNAIGTKYWVCNPFAYNDNLTSITLEAGNLRYEMVADGKLLIDTQRNAVVTALGNAAIPVGITTIGSNAFCNRPELVNYTIPEGVTTLTNPGYPNIGDNTFSQCANLESIVIPEGITVISSSAFRECPKLNSVVIPSSVTTIETNAFGSTGLSEITIPANVTYIGSQAFGHNQNLETVISYITDPFDISDDVFAKGWDLSTTTYPQTLYVPKGTKSLYEVKEGWNKMTIVEGAPSANIEFAIDEVKAACVAKWDTNEDGELSYEEAAAVTSLVDENDENDAFKLLLSNSKFTSFNEFQYFTGVTSLAFKDFANCEYLTSITLPNSITTIEAFAFYGCSGLKSVTIPNSVTSIGVAVFESCTGLESLVVAEGNTKYNSGENCNAIIETATNKLLSGCKNTTIPDGVTEICSDAFFGCKGLASMTIPNGVTTIGNNAFAGCSGLKSISIPKSVTYIGDNALGGCSALESLTVASGNTVYDSRNDCNALIHSATNKLILGTKNTAIPSSVKTIGGMSFGAITDLTSITIPYGVETIKSSAFWNCPDLASVTISNSVKTIEGGAFSYCDKLLNVHVDYEEPLVLTEDFLTNSGSATLYVPAGKKSKYQDAEYWKGFKEIIEEGSTPTTDRLYSSDISAYKGTQVVLPIVLSNEQTIAGFQFDLQLPEGFSVAKNGADYLASLTSRASGLSISASVLTSGSYRFVVVSSEGDKVTGTGGEVMNITLNIPSGATIGENTITLDNVLLTAVVNGENTSLYPDNATSKLTVLDYTLGDVNNDDHINVTDVVCVVDDILGRTPSNFVRPAADINGDNVVNVTDVMGLVDIILSAQGKAATRGLADENVDVIDGLELKNGENGQLSLSVKDARNYVASQMEVRLDEGQKLEGITLSDNFKQTHQLIFARTGRSAYTVLVFSMANEGYPEGDDELLKLNVSGGAGEIVVDEAMMVTREQNQKHMAPVSSYQVVTGTELMDIYSLDGRLVKAQAKDTNGLAKGVYIIDGKKVIVK